MKRVIKKKVEQTNVAVFAIVAAVSTALILVGMGYAAFVFSGLDSTISKDQKVNKEHSQQEDREQANKGLPAIDTPVDVNEINKKIQDLDKEFAKDTSKDDFNNDAFSDKALNL